MALIDNGDGTITRTGLPAKALEMLRGATTQAGKGVMDDPFDRSVPWFDPFPEVPANHPWRVEVRREIAAEEQRALLRYRIAAELGTDCPDCIGWCDCGTNL
jgi:hypothetical protein